MSLSPILVVEREHVPVSAWLARHRLTLGLTLLVALFHFAAFSLLCETGSWDHGPHLKVARDLTTEGRWGSYFLYHLIVALVSGWSRSPSVVATAGALVLTAAVVGRSLLSYPVLDPERQHPARAIAFSLALLFAMPLWNWWKFPKVYLGQITPNVWHNPTTTFAMPLALAVFLLAVEHWRRPRTTSALVLGLAMVACTLAKPNYVIAFAPCFALVLGWECARRFPERLGTRASEALLIFGPVMVGLVSQYLFTFQGDSADKDRVILAPMRAWSLYSPNVPASIVLGIAFPLTTAVLYPRGSFSDRRTLLAWAVLAVAIAQFALFAEEKRLAAANFAWGPFFADYVIFLLACAVLVRQPVSWRFVLATTVLALHAIAGALHLGAYLMEPVRTWVPD